MAGQANQHYVPQFYFRYFSENGKSICLLNRRSGEVVENASIKGQASKKYYYGNSEVEKALAAVDTEFSTLLSKVKSEGNFETFNEQEYLTLLQLIMLQITRTLSARERNQVAWDRMTQLGLEMQITNDENLVEEERAELYEAVKYAGANSQEFQIHQMKIAYEVAGHLMDLRPAILVNKTNRPFIFSDAPVVKINPHLKNVRLNGVLGVNSPGLILVFPLCEQLCLMLFDSEIYKIKGLSGILLPVRKLQDIKGINKLQLHNATKSVYFSRFEYMNYISGLWEQEQERLGDNLNVPIEAPLVNPQQGRGGDIFHVYERQLPYIPRLSFLKFEEMAEEDYVFSLRHPE